MKRGKEADVSESKRLTQDLEDAAATISDEELKRLLVDAADTIQALSAREEPGEWAPGIECEHGYDACPICDAKPESDPKVDRCFSKKLGTGRQNEGG